jgi:hypothetical protein
MGFGYAFMGVGLAIIGVWLVAKGFKPSPVTDGMVPAGLPQEDDHGPLGGGSRPEISPA